MGLLTYESIEFFGKVYMVGFYAIPSPYIMSDAHVRKELLGFAGIVWIIISIRTQV